MAMAVVLTRAFSRREAATVGNFWVDFTRAALYVLLPASCVVALLFIALGTPQTLSGAVDVTTLEARQTDRFHRSDRRPGGDQTDRQQRRRVFQRQLVASL
jgi:K+-transporting ATPase A subunit